MHAVQRAPERGQHSWAKSTVHFLRCSHVRQRSERGLSVRMRSGCGKQLRPKTWEYALTVSEDGTVIWGCMQGMNTA